MRRRAVFRSRKLGTPRPRPGPITTPCLVPDPRIGSVYRRRCQARREPSPEGSSQAFVSASLTRPNSASTCSIRSHCSLLGVAAMTMMMRFRSIFVQRAKFDADNFDALISSRRGSAFGVLFLNYIRGDRVWVLKALAGPLCCQGRFHIFDSCAELEASGVALRGCSRHGAAPPAVTIPSTAVCSVSAVWPCRADI